MNKDYTNLTIKRSIDAALREIAIANQRTPQGMIEFWIRREKAEKK